MDKKTKTTLIIVGVVVVLCLIACVVAFFVFRSLGQKVAESISTDPVEAARSAHEIADYDLPTGYSEQMSMDLGIYQYVMIVPTGQASSSMMIMLAQFQSGSNLSPEQMVEQLQRQMEQQQPGVNMTVVESRPVTIRGTETQLIISEGTMAGGIVYRQLATVFPGKDGQAILMIQGTGSDWDEALVDEFIASIH